MPKRSECIQEKYPNLTTAGHQVVGEPCGQATCSVAEAMRTLELAGQQITGEKIATMIACSCPHSCFYPDYPTYVKAIADAVRAGR